MKLPVKLQLLQNISNESFFRKSEYAELTQTLSGLTGMEIFACQAILCYSITRQKIRYQDNQYIEGVAACLRYGKRLSQISQRS